MRNLGSKTTPECGLCSPASSGNQLLPHCVPSEERQSLWTFPHSQPRQPHNPFQGFNLPRLGLLALFGDSASPAKEIVTLGNPEAVAATTRVTVVKWPPWTG